MGKIELVIEYNKGVISIPFADIKSVDQFTMGYDNELELFSNLNNILNLNIKNGQLSNIYLKNSYHARSKGHKLQYQILPVKYSTDDCDLADLQQVYAKYYKDNHTRILAYREGIRYVKHDVIRNYNLNDDKITDIEIDMAVNSYFKDGSYKTYRDAYFRVKGAGYTVKTLPKVETESINKTNLSSYDTDDDYLAYLQRYAALGEEEADKALEELSYLDMEEVEKLANEKHGLFDYLDKGSKLNDQIDEIDSIMSLEALSGMSIDKLKEVIADYQNKYQKRH